MPVLNSYLNEDTVDICGQTLHCNGWGKAVLGLVLLQKNAYTYQEAY